MNKVPARPSKHTTNSPDLYVAVACWVIQDQVHIQHLSLDDLCTHNAYTSRACTPPKCTRMCIHTSHTHPERHRHRHTCTHTQNTHTTCTQTDIHQTQTCIHTTQTRIHCRHTLTCTQTHIHHRHACAYTQHRQTPMQSLRELTTILI